MFYCVMVRRNALCNFKQKERTHSTQSVCVSFQLASHSAHMHISHCWMHLYLFVVGNFSVGRSVSLSLSFPFWVYMLLIKNKFQLFMRWKIKCTQCIAMQNCQQQRKKKWFRLYHNRTNFKCGSTDSIT